MIQTSGIFCRVSWEIY